MNYKFLDLNGLGSLIEKLKTIFASSTQGNHADSAYQHSLLKSGNPHNVTKSQIGLSNVENKSGATIRSEMTKEEVVDALGYTPPTANTNTTYTLTKSGSTITLTGSDGKKTSVTDSNTTYTLNSFGVNSTATELNYLDGVTSNVQTQLDNKISNSKKGVANGIASLDSNGKVPSSQLPSYVDDVIEYDSLSEFPSSGETGKIYIDKTTNKTYRWSGTSYIEISQSLALGTTSSTAFRGDYGNTAYQHSLKTSGNPHNVTKSDVGLSNVGNFKAVSTIANQGLTTTEKSNARANIGAGTSNFSGSYTDLTNKPTIPTVGNGTIKITQNGTTKGSFTMNQSGNATIALTDNNTTYSQATSSALGLVKIGYTENGKNYPVELSNGQMFVNVPWTDTNTKYSQATSTTAGLVKIGFTESGKNYPVELNTSGQMFVNVPWTDTNTTYGLASTSANGLLKQLNGSTSQFMRGDGIWATPPNTTYNVATETSNGLLSSTDKVKLDSIATGANKYVLPTASSTTLGGVKTTSKVTSSSGYTACPIISGVPYYKDTNTTYTLSSFGVTATAAELNKLDGCTATVTELNYVDGVTSNIQTQLNGKAPTSHNHSASNITSGTLPIARGGTGGTSASTARANIDAINILVQDSQPTSQNVGDFWLEII